MEFVEFEDMLVAAQQDPNPGARLARIGAFLACRHYSVHKRWKKPFDPFVGETFELITPNYFALIE